MPPPGTRDEQVAGEMQDREIPTAAVAAQDKTEAASSTSAPAIPHTDVTNSAHLSSDAQPRPTRKTLVTRSSQPVPNSMHNVLADSGQAQPARTSRTPASAAPVADLLRDPGGTIRVIVPALASSYSSRRDRRRRSRRYRKEKTQDRSAESASRAPYSTSFDPK